ncbi:MAG: four helix bundle protein [Paludibacteraceae bacterium]|nr:four helix bundle protein [Paludibacteraceae bacterium]
MLKYNYSFEKLEVWVKAKHFVKLIYLITKEFPEDEKFILVSQLKRASISVVSNIAEGTSRKSMKDQMRFTEIAYGSVLEIYCQLQVSFDLGYICETDLNNALLLINELTNKLNALRNSQEKRLRTI